MVTVFHPSEIFFKEEEEEQSDEKAVTKFRS